MFFHELTQPFQSLVMCSDSSKLSVAPKPNSSACIETLAFKRHLIQEIRKPAVDRHLQVHLHP